MTITELEMGIFQTPKRIVVIGDLHSDYASTIEVLKLGKLIKLKGTRWIWAGTPGTVVVQLGDVLDGRNREGGKDEESDIRLLKFLDFLDSQAIKQGSRVLSLIGNHEMMSVRAYLDPESGLAYAGKKSIQSFGGLEQRAAAFRPGAEWAVYLSKHRYTVLKVGPFIFVHGGISPKIADRFTIPEINKMTKEYLAGNLPWNKDLKMLLDDSNSLLWDRSWASDHVDCTKLDHVLSKYNGKAALFGHTPHDRITQRCGNRLWACDTGLSKAISGSNSSISRCQLVEITFLPNKKVSITPRSVDPTTYVRT